jgi:phosphoglycerate kinase
MSFSDVLRLPELDLTGRRVFLRADLDVPLTSQGRLTNEASIARLAPTLELLLRADCRVVLAGHVQREASLGAISKLVSSLLGQQVFPLGRDFWKDVRDVAPGGLALAPNLDSYPEEASNEPRWAGKVARGFDVYVNDAPDASRQARASVVGIASALAARGAGLALGADLDMSRDFVELPAAPYAAVVGGDDLAGRAAFLRGLVDRVDSLLLGGVLASTFLVAGGWKPRAARYEAGALDVALDLLERASARGVRLLLPSDGVTLDYDVVATGTRVSRELQAFGEHDELLDIGSGTRLAYRAALSNVVTVLWSGSLSTDGSVEGTRDVLEEVLEQAPYTGVVGEPSIALADRLRFSPRFRWLAQGGDAAEELMAGVVSPGIQSLRQPAAKPALVPAELSQA